MIVKCSWSGGKDSTAAVILHIQQKDLVKAVCYVPMLTDNIPLILSEQYNFILNSADRFRAEGAEVYIITGISYYDYVHKISTRGKYKGRAFGFPCFIKGKCGFARDSKVKSINSFDCGFYDYLDIGIAYDEKDRIRQLTDKKRSILFERGITEDIAYKICQDNSLLSPVYSRRSRDGCALCPHAGKSEREEYFSDYPEAKEIVKELQYFCMENRPDIYPLRDRKMFIDNNGGVN